MLGPSPRVMIDDAVEREELITLLAREGLVDEERLRTAFADAPEDRLPEEHLIEAGTIAEDALYGALSAYHGLPLVRLDPGAAPCDVLPQLPERLMLDSLVFPIERDGARLTLAMADPLDIVAEDAVRYRTRCRVERVLATPREIRAALAAAAQPRADLQSVVARLPGPPQKGDLEFLAAEEPEAEEDEGESTRPVIGLVNSILRDGVERGASDIHVECAEGRVRVRYRVDGILRDAASLPKGVQNACLSRFKLIAGLDISEKRAPQDGRIKFKVEGRVVDLRVSSLPSFYGEKIVCRILDGSKGVMELERVGFAPQDLERFKTVLRSPQGMIVVTGPTGSGKTSTLYSVLARLNEGTRNVVTVEDPVELRVEGINQVQVHNRAGLTFAAALRSILRQDPDVVMVGEIRDVETASIAVEAAQTGHLVLSTLHTNDAPSSVTRLVHMGVPEYMVASSLRCVVAQRLVRRLCPACREEAPVDPEALEMLGRAGVTPPARAFRKRGCDACEGNGYRGRMGLFEVLVVSDRMRERIVAGASETALSALAREEGMALMLEDGLRKVEGGETDLEEVLRVVSVGQSGGRECPACRSKLREEFLTCPYCEPDEAMTPCGSCGQPLEAAWKVCPFCRRAAGAARVETAPRPAGDPVVQLRPRPVPEPALEALQEERLRLLELEADRLARRHEAVDPSNRLVLAEIERRWNALLDEIARLRHRAAATSLTVGSSPSSAR